jgi:two-component system, OmpR family, sensor kinase
MNRLAHGLRRMPIRVKLALISIALMSIVMAGTGVFLYLRFEDELDTSIDQALASRAQAAAVLSSNSKNRTNLIGELSQEEGFGELVSPTGRVVEETPGVDHRLLIPPKLLATARRGPVYFEQKVEDIAKHARLIARPVGGSGGNVVVAGTTLKDRERANESLVRALVIGVPIALLLATAAAIALIGGALRPVEQMRSRAATISAGEADARLPLPEAQDEIRRLGETLNEMLARLQAAFAREREFVADASHELRTPLAILKTELELASREGRTNGELTAAVRSAAEEVDRLSRLAEDLLVLARADGGRLPVCPAPQPLEPLVWEVADLFAMRAHADARKLTVEVPANLEAPVDSERIRQALANLVDNALTHGDGNVRLWARRLNSAVELHVEDGGSGFPPDFIAHAFERFTRADAARGPGGTGLGLAIVDAIARGHGGYARARNTATGSDVWVSVPTQSSARMRSGIANQNPPKTADASSPATTAAVPE